MTKLPTTLEELEKERNFLSSQMSSVQEAIGRMKYGVVRAEADRLMAGFEGSVFPYSTIDPRGIHSQDYQGKIRFFKDEKSRKEDSKSGSLDCSGPSGRLILSLLEIIATLKEKKATINISGEATAPTVMTGGFEPCSVCGSRSLRCGCD